VKRADLTLTLPGGTSPRKIGFLTDARPNPVHTVTELAGQFDRLQDIVKETLSRVDGSPLGTEATSRGPVKARICSFFSSLLEDAPD
jgi:hypothetical protein